MSPRFEFKVDEIFHIGNKTVFAGVMNSAEKQIANAECRVVVDGQTVDTLFIEGEVLGTRHRDLWTTRPTSLASDTAKNHTLLLVSP